MSNLTAEQRDPPPELVAHTERHFDAIDAGFFSGDTFHSEAACARAEWYMARWQREIANLRAAKFYQEDVP